MLGTYPVLNQQPHNGWVKIGRVGIGRISNTPSNNITIEVNDNEIADFDESAENRKIGVDAILLVRDRDIGWNAVNSDKLITDENCFGPPKQSELEKVQDALASVKREYRDYRACVDDELDDLDGELGLIADALVIERDVLRPFTYLSLVPIIGKIGAVIAIVVDQLSNLIETLQKLSDNLSDRFNHCA